VAEAGRRNAFVGVSALLFAASAVASIRWADAMSAMDGIPMAGGWTLSAAWTPMCGQSWSRAAASFVGMWTLMMAAMMLPSLAPTLWRYAQAPGTRGEPGVTRLTAMAAVGYFCVWTIIGALVFVLGAALAAAAMQVPGIARAVPGSAAMLVVLAGVFQFTTWKARQLARCRGREHQASDGANVASAWRYGVSLGLQCSRACAGLTVLLLVIGVMDLRAMVLVTATVTAERLAPPRLRVAWTIGAMLIAAGLYGVLQCLLASQ
jgi:predicted metal-binding membrane protein